jgi:hypothetical protein
MEGWRIMRAAYIVNGSRILFLNLYMRQDPPVPLILDPVVP